MERSVCDITKINVNCLALSNNLLTHTHTHTHTYNKVSLLVKSDDMRGWPRVSGLVFALTARTWSVLSFVNSFIYNNQLITKQL